MGLTRCYKTDVFYIYYCNMVEWCWWDSSLIWKTNWLPSVLWHCWFGHMTCKNRPRYDLYNVFSGWDVKLCPINQSIVCRVWNS